jgi:hypothetical protein
VERGAGAGVEALALRELATGGGEVPRRDELLSVLEEHLGGGLVLGTGGPCGGDHDEPAGERKGERKDEAAGSHFRFPS